jgi:hypothetical protein
LTLAVLLVVGGSAGAGWAVRAATGRRRPLDFLGALLAPLFIGLAVVGGIMLFVPRFLR